MTVEWGDPPTPDLSREYATRWRIIARELQTRPGQWAQVGEYPLEGKKAYDHAWLIRAGHRAGMGKGDFEARVVTNTSARLLYVRYVGGAP